MKRTIACLTTAALLLVPTARGETIVATSLEWLTCAAEVVVVARIDEVVTTRGPGDVRYDDCTATVLGVVRGKVEKCRVTFCLRRLSDDSKAQAWRKSGAALLLFLSPSRDHGREKHLDGRLVPTSDQFPLSVIDLAASGKLAIDARFDVLTDKEAILKACQKAARRLEDHDKKGRKVEMTRVEVPTDSKAWGALYAGSGCYLKIPAFTLPEDDD
jgi:hypothetical protein